MTDEQAKEPLYGFWTYDIFPFTLSGVIDETQPLQDKYPAARYVTSYGKYFNMLATIRGAKGEKLRDGLKALELEYERDKKALEKRYGYALRCTLKAADIVHPYAENNYK